jgi:hypothetical protein
MRGIETRLASEGQVEVDWEEYGETVKEVGSGLQLRTMAVGSEGEKYAGDRKGEKCRWIGHGNK